MLDFDGRFLSPSDKKKKVIDRDFVFSLLGDKIVLCMQMLETVISKPLNGSVVTKQCALYWLCEMLLIVLLNFYNAEHYLFLFV